MNEKVKKNPKIPPVGVVVKEGVRIGIVRMIEDRDRGSGRQGFSPISFSRPICFIFLKFFLFFFALW